MHGEQVDVDCRLDDGGSLQRHRRSWVRKERLDDEPTSFLLPWWEFFVK